MSGVAVDQAVNQKPGFFEPTAVDEEELPVCVESLGFGSNRIVELFWSRIVIGSRNDKAQFPTSLG